MPAIRLSKIAKELQVGVQTVVEFLAKRNPDTSYTPNSKLTVDEVKALVKDHGNALTDDERKTLVDKYLTPQAAPKEEPKKAEPADKHVPTPAEEPEKKGPKVLGHVNLDSNGNVVKPKPAAKKAEPVKKGEPTKKAKPTEEPTMPEPKKTVPNKEEEQKRPKVKEEVKPAKTAEMNKPEPKKTESPAPAPSKPESKVEEPTKAPAVEKIEPAKPTKETKAPAAQKVDPAQATKPAEPAKKLEPTKKAEPTPEPDAKEDSEATDKPSGVYRIGTADNMGVKVVGKVDLSAIEPTRPKRGKKRKRTIVKGGGKVDIEKQAKEQKTDPGRPARAKQEGSRQQQQQPKGRKAKRQKQKQQQRPEVTQEDIQKQIKETMAAIQGKSRGGGASAKYRKDKREERRKEAMQQMEQEERESKTLQLTEFVTANDLAQLMDVPVNDIITFVFNLGMMVSINQRLDKDTIEMIVSEYGFEPEFVDIQMMDDIETEEDNEEDLEPRAPVVTVMGHVDHGKTSLLDAIRNTDVTSGEAGGITQHVGAYRVKLDDGRSITFLDTPGHEAFTAMRARGAQVTDVVIIVVAADDGVMPQTKEAISHASLAGVPIVFAINKIDREGANPERIKEELANMNYLVEDWGGKYQSQEISAKKGIGIHELLEKVLLEAELLELKANPHKRAIGSVLESTMEQGRGYTTKVLIQDGTLKVGDHIVAGSNYGRVKALFDEYGENVSSVGPSEPVKVLGLNGATASGETLNVLETEAEVREVATKREQLHREQRERTQRLPSLMDIGRRIAEGKVQELNIIVKGDMDGSVEALSDSIEKLSTDEVRVNVIYKAVGQITESDVSLASASDAIIIGFQVRPAQGARRMAEDEGVEIRIYSIIYDALDDVKTAMEGMLSPEMKETVTANLEVRDTFKISKVGTIAGCYVLDGKISRSDKVRVIRDGVVIHTGELASLQRYKDDAREVTAGLECGLNIAGFNDIQKGDIIEAYQEIAVKRTLD